MNPTSQTRQWNHMVSVLSQQIHPSSNGCHYVEAYLIEGQRVVGSQQFEAKKPSSEGSTIISAVQDAR
jgi:hypothetical protein